ncbi:MAG: nucleotide sugar dehydrogenase [Gammaproteobacteria bacterium]|nr:nucleotide sugar dehydrogenase [Gammaproteobacteria bacterium]
MKVAVVGLWHLGCVTAACVAEAGHTVLAYDSNKKIIEKLQKGQAPLFEGGLDELITKTHTQGLLNFSSDANDVSTADIVWVTYDTPVDDNDVADIEFVMSEVKAILPHLKKNALVLISSQLPVGSARKLQKFCDEQWHDKAIHFAVSPENLRLGKAIDVFKNPERIVVGIQSEADKELLQELLNPFTKNIVWMSIESAEMTKHALNAFLATSVVFINELATLCERVGADAREVERGLKSEDRIGPKAYLRPGNAIAGGTLARDVNYLIQIGEQQELPTPLFSALLDSNQSHKQWSARRMLQVVKNLRDKTITTLGLTYKVGTDTLRRSTAIEFCEWLKEQGAKVVAYDPLLTHLPEHLADFIELKTTMEEALVGADAVIITNECPQFTSLTADQIVNQVSEPLVFDAGGFLMKTLGSDKRISYYSVGNQI